MIPEVLNVADYLAGAITAMAVIVGLCVGGFFAYRIVWTLTKWVVLAFGGPIAAVGLWWKGK